MFHKYDFGTASQITSRRWTNENIDPNEAVRFQFFPIILIEICVIAALCLAFRQAPNHAPTHKAMAHSHHSFKHVG